MSLAFSKTRRQFLLDRGPNIFKIRLNGTLRELIQFLVEGVIIEGVL